MALKGRLRTINYPCEIDPHEGQRKIIFKWINDLNIKCKLKKNLRIQKIL
jgi:hypothetical protein